MEDIDTYVLGGLYLLNNNPMNSLFMVLGVSCNYALNPILKELFPQPRPRGDPKKFQKILDSGKKPLFDDLGMPSFHAEVITFIVMFVILSSKRTKNKWIHWAMYFLSFSILIREYFTGDHSIPQLFVGSIIGISSAFLFSFMAYDGKHGWGFEVKNFISWFRSLPFSNK